MTGMQKPVFKVGFKLKCYFRVANSIQQHDFKNILIILILQMRKSLPDQGHSLLGHFESNIKNAKCTIMNFINDITPQKKQKQQIDFAQLLHEQNQTIGIKQPNCMTNKIEQAMRNSSIAKLIYHSQEPQKLAEQCMQHSEVLRNIQSQVSISNCSKILQLKVVDAKQQPEDQMKSVLSKFSPSFFGGWSDRFCILTKNRFVYMENQDQNSPIAGILNFNILSFSINQQGLTSKNQHYFQLKVDKGDKNFIFKSSNHDQTTLWCQKIKIYISLSQGKLNSVTSLSNYHRFWRKDYTSKAQFEKMTKTGDILLFRGKKSSAILQRKVTGQEYDHIGVVLLNAFGQKLILQANGGFGVGICPWRKFIKNKWYEDQQIVAIRHLKIARSEEFLNQVTKFVEDNIGKEYNFSFKKFITSRHSQVDNQKSSFFCSSLVAKLYKKLGLLDPNISSNRYMPYDFSQKQNLKLLNGKYGQAFLDREMLIVFQ